MSGAARVLDGFSIRIALSPCPRRNLWDPTEDLELLVLELLVVVDLESYAKQP